MSAARALMTFHYSRRWQDQAREIRFGMGAIDSIEVTVGNHFVENRNAFGLISFDLSAIPLGVQSDGQLNTLVLREPGMPNDLHFLILQQEPISAKEMAVWTLLFRSRLGGDP